MKTLVLLLTLATTNAHAQSVYVVGKPKGEITKLEALRKLVNDANAEVYECKPKALSPKATLINK